MDSSSPPLIILQVTLTFWEPSPQIELSLTRGLRTPGPTENWHILPRELSVPDHIDADTPPLDLNLPPHITSGIKNSLKDDAEKLPLWLRFAKPHGYLSALPWERELTRALERPVLRFPDLLERPYEDRDVLELAICLDPDRGAPAAKVQKMLDQLTAAILSAYPRVQTRVHLFTPSFWHQQLRYDQRLQIHEPLSAPTSVAGLSQKSIESPIPSLWTIWMKAALGTRSLDAVYFLCNSAMTEFGPALRMSNSLWPNEKYHSWTYVDAMDLATIVTRAGAWAALFSNPPPGPAGPTLALVADALAQTRPTAVLYQPLAGDEQIASLRTACAFLFAPSSAPAPTIADGFLYCSPNFVEAYENLRISSSLRTTEADASIFHSEIKQRPSWATSLQRQSEFSDLERLRRNAADVLLASQDSARVQVLPDASIGSTAGSDDTLEQIHKVIGDYLLKSGG